MLSTFPMARVIFKFGVRYYIPFSEHKKDLPKAGIMDTKEHFKNHKTLGTFELKHRFVAIDAPN